MEDTVQNLRSLRHETVQPQETTIASQGLKAMQTKESHILAIIRASMFAIVFLMVLSLLHK